ncbi:MAG: TetM/TetW/TetO/TetS family tetracycline resistance ribosomal protection protein [Actinobacteria bacterium]|nr:TetM/TetW/TetO/TetS family tetracycline resistance ribosomal protection protein [Actinomycetota bacterium]
MSRRTLNLGILAHVDAGKTTLTERLLHAAGVIHELGSVDAGTTQTDTMALEQQRGITIKTAVATFAIDDVTINLIDTPGHPDFIAEVERVLAVLDGAVLVISAVEGVQAQTPLLWRALQRLHVPTLLFVNKLDRAGADPERVLAAVSERLTPAVVPMGADRDTVLPVLAEHDEALLAAYVGGSPVSDEQVREALAAQTKEALVYPVFFGSALAGAGVEELMAGIAELLPAEAGDGDAPVSSTVFKIERDAAGHKIAYARMFAGTLRTRDRVDERKITAIAGFEGGSAVHRDSVSAGEIAKLWGLGDIRIGDPIGDPRTTGRQHFPPPTLETVVVPSDPEEKGALHTALTQLAEQDPLINVRQDDVRQEFSVSLYGEVQKEVIAATLASDYGLEVEFRETTTICIERPAGTGAAVERKEEEPNPFLATVGLRIDPGPPGSGLGYALEQAVHGTMPRAFFNAVEDTVHQVLREGLLGWQVTDCTVTLTHTGYYPRQSAAHQGFSKAMSSTGEDFRKLTPLVVMSALVEAGTVVCEPVNRFRLDVPADTLGTVLPGLARLGAVTETPAMRGAWATIEGELRTAGMRELQQRLRGLTRGEGVLESVFDHYEPVGNPVPSRPRTDANPLNREEYLLGVSRARS